MIPLPSRDTPWAPLVVLAVLVLLPIGRASEAAIAIGAIAGLVLALRGRLDVRSDRGVRLAAILFACYWLAALVSGIAPVAPERTWTTIATTLRFLPFAAFAVFALRDARAWRATTLATSVVVALWIIDAFVQIATGYSLGGPAEAERLSGIFGAGNLKLGPVLAVLAPFVLIEARDRFGWPGIGLAFVLLAVPILLAGSRAAWLMYGIVCFGVAWKEAPNKRMFALAVVVSGIVIVGAGTLALRNSPGFGLRIERTLLVLRGTEGAVDAASAGRVRIWRTAIDMWEAHPATGVGVRGFRYAYPEYAARKDAFVDTTNETGASHAHQIVLEVLSETGAIGLVFWIVGVIVAIRAWRRADVAGKVRARAPALALVAMTFPLNTHLAFYSAWWGLLFWWLVALYCAAISARGDATDA